MSVFSSLNQIDSSRPVSLLDSRLSIIENTLTSSFEKSIEGFEWTSEDFEDARSNACYLIDACLYLMATPNSESSITTLERCERISEDCLEIVQLLFRYSLIAAPIDTEAQRTYHLMPAKILLQKGILKRTKGLKEEAIECFRNAIAIAKRHEAGVFALDTLSKPIFNLAAILMEQDKLDEARTLFEELYELLCSKSGPADALLQSIVIQLALIHELHGDSETSEHYMSVAYENVSNLDEGLMKDDLLKSIVHIQSHELIYDASMRSVGDAGNENASRPLEDESLSEEEAPLTVGGPVQLHQAAAYQHLVDDDVNDTRA
jgi:hypothetical protein